MELPQHGVFLIMPRGTVQPGNSAKRFGLKPNHAFFVVPYDDVPAGNHDGPAD